EAPSASWPRPQFPAARGLATEQKWPESCDPAIKISGKIARSGTGVQHRHRAPVLRPAGDVVAHRDRPLLAVGNRTHAIGFDAARDKILADRLGAPRTE